MRTWAGSHRAHSRWKSVIKKNYRMQTMVKWQRRSLTSRKKSTSTGLNLLSGAAQSSQVNEKSVYRKQSVMRRHYIASKIPKKVRHRETRFDTTVFQIANQGEKFSCVLFEWKSVYVLTCRLTGSTWYKCLEWQTCLQWKNTFNFHAWQNVIWMRTWAHLHPN